MGMIGRRVPPSTQEADKPMGFDDFELRLGDVMRGERATMAKSLLDVQRELKIKATYIAAIENCDISAFETPGFVAGYVRSYARYLGMDAEWAFERFCAEANFTVVHGMSAAAPGRSRDAERSNTATPSPTRTPASCRAARRSSRASSPARSAPSPSCDADRRDRLWRLVGLAGDAEGRACPGRTGVGRDGRA